MTNLMSFIRLSLWLLVKGVFDNRHQLQIIQARLVELQDPAANAEPRKPGQLVADLQRAGSPGRQRRDLAPRLCLAVRDYSVEGFSFSAVFAAE